MSHAQEREGTLDRDAARPFRDLRESGLLWLINRVVFHPRGFALALVFDDSGAAVGWKLDGDGTEVWRFEDGHREDARFAAAQATLQGERHDR